MIWSYLLLINNSSLSTKGCLPKGVIRGCSECNDCQKVLARWDREGACTCMLEEAPVFHPNKEEFKDTFKYIDSIRQQVEPYGFCRIVPPPSWQPPCFFEESDIWHSLKFSTQIQRVNELQNHWSCGKASAAHDTREMKKRRMAYEIGDGCAANYVSAECHGAESCESQSGPQFSLIAFKRYADYFLQHYFSRDPEVSNTENSPTLHQEEQELLEQSIEGEYWRIVEKPTEEIELLHGTDLDISSFASLLSVSSNSEQASDFEENSTSGWDLNNITRCRGSLLSFETLVTSGILAPRLHVGMCFSTLPWTVQDHYLYKIYYLHLGAPRVWYGTSRCNLSNFEQVIKKHLLDSSEEHPELRHKLGRQVSPANLKSEDIPVYHCIQHPREFVLVLPGAYHSGFDCGFNCSVSAVFAPLDWLPHGLLSTYLYREQRRKTSISYDKVLLRAANEAVKTQWECLVKGNRSSKNMMWKEASGKDGILAKTLRARIRLESKCRAYLSSPNQSRKMDKSFDAADQKRECSTCYYDLYLSAVNCPCSPDRFSCLKHVKDLCSCPWSGKVILFRYLISELNILLEAVEGKVSAIRSWVKENLGMVLLLDNPDVGDIGLPVAPSSNVEASNGITKSSDKDESPGSKFLSNAKSPLGEISSKNHKGKEIASATGSTSSDSSDSMSSMSSLGSDVEVYVQRLRSHIQRLRSQRMRNFLPACNKEGASMPNTTGKSNSLQNFGENSVAVHASNAEKDGASSSKLLPDAKKSSSDDTSSSSLSGSDVEAYIARIRSLKNSNKVGRTVSNRTGKSNTPSNIG